MLCDGCHEELLNNDVSMNKNCFSSNRKASPVLYSVYGMCILQKHIHAIITIVCLSDSYALIIRSESEMKANIHQSCISVQI